MSVRSVNWCLTLTLNDLKNRTDLILRPDWLSEQQITR